MKKFGKPSIKEDAVVESLRKQILTGKYPAGCRLPTRNEFNDIFNVSGITIQRALDRLASDGFVEARGRLGTFVVAHPPHTTNYALIFPSRPGAGNTWVRFWDAMMREAAHIPGDGVRQFLTFFGIEHERQGADFQRLITLTQNHQLAGLCFATTPFFVADTILATTDIPRVAVMSGPVEPGLAKITTDSAMFLRKALDYFAVNGRRRIAVLGIPGLRSSQAEILKQLDARGLTTRPYWFFGIDVSPAAASWAREYIRLLMLGGSGERPDGLLIFDDNLVEHACAGIVDSGIAVRKDLDVVAHCNFPWPTPSVLGVRRLGYDARVLLRKCIELIDRQRRGEQIMEPFCLPAMFEEELEADAVVERIDTHAKA